MMNAKRLRDMKRARVSVCVCVCEKERMKERSVRTTREMILFLLRLVHSDIASFLD